MLSINYIPEKLSFSFSLKDETDNYSEKFKSHAEMGKSEMEKITGKKLAFDTIRQGAGLIVVNLKEV